MSKKFTGRAFPLQPIAPYEKGKPRTLILHEEANEIVAAINALRNMVFSRGGTYEVKVDRDKIVLQVPDNTDSGGGSTTSSVVAQYKIISDGGDWWNVKTWDGTTLGSIFFRAIKPYKLRAGANKIASEVIRTVTYTYTYTAVTSGGVTNYYTRAVSGSDGSAETDYVIPDPIANDIIYCVECSTSVFGTALISIATATKVSGGTGFTANDILSVAGGTGTAATIKVLTVSSGVIATYTLLTTGRYTAAPSLSSNAVTGGTGTGATFDLTLATDLIDLNVDGRAWAR